MARVVVRDPVTGEARLVKAKLAKAQVRQEALVKSVLAPLVDEQIAMVEARLADLAARLDALGAPRSGRD